MTFRTGAPFDDSIIQDNLGLLAFQIMEAASVAGIEKYIDFFADQFEDASGIDATESVDELYDAVNDRYGATSGIADETTSGQAISGGDSGADVKGRAFDDNLGLAWICSQRNPGVSAAAYIGQDFGAGASKKLTKFNVLQSTNSYWRVLSVKVEFSDNGASWTTLETVSLINDSSAHEYALSDHAQSHRYWRLLANAEPGPAGSGWEVMEVQMYFARAGFSLVSNSVEAESNDPSSVKLLLLVDLNGLTITLGSDLVGYVSIDDGANYEPVILKYLGLDGTGRAIYSGSLSPIARADKTVRIKSVVANSKNIFLKAWVAFWKY